MKQDTSRKYGPFAETTPNGQSGWIDEDRQPLMERVVSMLHKLNGYDLFTYSIWLGDDQNSIVATPKEYSHSFIQAAGSSEAITVEVRLVGEDEQMHLYVIGKKAASTKNTLTIPISQERSVEIYENEVFTVEEATEIFNYYSLHENVSSTYSLRELDLSKEQSIQR